jgi:PKHD-type hydroxylase
MLIEIEGVLSSEEAATFRARLEGAAWVDGAVTAGEQSALAKHNLQVPEDAPEARELAQDILGRLGRNPAFISAALPLKVIPPLFNRYEAGMRFDTHIDNAIRFSGPVRYRTDLAATLFLTEAEDYEGGELIVEDTYGGHSVKLPAGSMVLYPATSRHRVAPVTAGSRWAAFFWAQSMIRDDARRAHLYELDQTIQRLGARLGAGDADVVALTGGYHNLVRLWAEV